MQQTGIIQKLHINTAEVEITRSSACGDSCASCGLCPGRTAIVEAVNDVNASVGDTVIINMSDKKVLGAAFLVYIVPLIMMIIGYFAGFAMLKNETFGIITGFFTMTVVFPVIRFIDKKNKQRYTPHIVRVISSEI